MAPEMATVYWELVAGMVSELEIEKASGMPLEIKLIAHLSLEEIHNVSLAPLPFCLLLFVRHGRDSRPGGVSCRLGVQISLCQGV
jgi:hypothetical protein